MGPLLKKMITTAILYLALDVGLKLYISLTCENQLCFVTVWSHLWRLKSKHCINCIYIYNTSTSIRESRQSSDEKKEKRQRRLKSEVNEDVCYVEEKLISPGGSAGLSLPFLGLLSSIKLWIVFCSLRGRQWNSHAHTKTHVTGCRKTRVFKQNTSCLIFA